MTTDTALLVSSEILELRKSIAELTFIENPQVSTDSNTRSFLDSSFSIEKLAQENPQGPCFNPASKFAQEMVSASTRKAVQSFEGTTKFENDDGQQAFVEESTVMEGFIYRKLIDMENKYPVLKYDPVEKKMQKTLDFPVLPVGMRDIWAGEDDFAGMF